jgi:hypothetical protein
MKAAKLKKPEYKVISSAAMTHKGNSLTLINLGKEITKKLISKNDIVATGTIGMTPIQCKSLENYEEGVSEIYVIISGINYSGSITLTIDDLELVSSVISISEEDCYNVYSLYYGKISKIQKILMISVLLQ